MVKSVDVDCRQIGQTAGIAESANVESGIVVGCDGDDCPGDCDRFLTAAGVNKGFDFCGELDEVFSAHVGM
jgi:hypothetical protein